MQRAPAKEAVWIGSWHNVDTRQMMELDEKISSQRPGSLWAQQYFLTFEQFE